MVSEVTVNYMLVFCRVTTALVFLYSASGKGLDIHSFEHAVANFQLLPPKLHRLAAWCFLAGEILVIWLVARGGQFLVWGFGLAALLLLVFSAALASVLVRKITAACNCFGASEKPVTGYDLWRNGGFVACALLGLGASTNGAAQANLQLAEVGLVGLVAAVFVVMWVNLGEIAQIFR
ncbi:MAG: hypothetical protein OEZ02_06080 [Anaerolineae bacterium]|nr:hypothetical protein [Anaerolineae bacterium]